MPPLSTLLTRNWTLKVSAFGIALLLWFSVRIETPTRQELPGVSVRVELTDPDWALVDEPIPATVQVRFAGPSREIFRMPVDRPGLLIPIDQVSSGDTTVVLRTQWIRVQDRPGVVVEDIQPSSVRLSFEPIERVERPPAARLEGELPDALALSAEPVVRPSVVRVSGPRSRVSEMDSVHLLPIDLSLVQASGPVQAGVDTIQVHGMQVTPITVEVDIRVEARIERVVSGVPVAFPDDLEGLDMEGIEVSPGTVSVTLVGARSVVDGSDPAALVARIELDEVELPEPGESVTVPILLEGLPSLLEGRLQVDEVTIRRLDEGPP